MAVRDIILIDEEKCTGCGECIDACVEGALELVNGKAKLVKDDYCDGLGACLGECPEGALTIVKREAPDFDEEAVKAYMHTAETRIPPARTAPPAGGLCPGSAARQFQAAPDTNDKPAGSSPSALTHWPVQLKLINPTAAPFQGADILIAADCTAFAFGSFHNELLAGRRLIVACPKLDSPEGYVEKLAELFRVARPRSVTVARMEVPCCGGLGQMVLAGREQAGCDLPVREVTIGIQGDVLRERELS